MSLWRRLVAYAGVAFAGGMLLMAGLLKSLDPAGFATQIATDMPFLAGLAGPLAVAGVAVEMVLGSLFLLGFRRRWMVVAGMILVVAFIAVTLPKIGDEDAASCGCFGNFVVRTPGQAITEDLLMLAGLGLGLIGGAGSLFVVWRGGLVALVTVLGIGLPLATPSLPLDNFATRLKPGVTADDLQLTETIPELAAGEHIVLLAELDDSCEVVPESLYTYTDARPDARLWLLRPSDVLSRDGAIWLCLPGTEVIELPLAVLRPLYRTLPRSFRLVDGTVRETFAGLPGSTDD